jgi:MipA family protein
VLPQLLSSERFRRLCFVRRPRRGRRAPQCNRRSGPGKPIAGVDGHTQRVERDRCAPSSFCRIAAGALAAAALFTIGAVRADQELELLLGDLPAGTAGIGGALRSTGEPHIGRSGDLDFVPLYIYEGRRLFVRGTSLGVHVLNGADLEFDVIARYRFWRLDPGADPRLEGLAERSQTVDAGLGLRWRTPAGEFSVEWIGDLLDRHGGHELETAYRYRFRHHRWQISPFIGLTWLDADLARYYFGVPPGQSRDDRPAYAPGRVRNLRYGVNTTFDLGESFSLYANLGVTELDRRLVDSPIVEQTLWPTIFVGSSYFFGSVYEPSERVRDTRRAEWSWRLNYGYQAQGNIVGDIDQGDFRRSVDADTNIAGLTVSKLLDEGRRFDFVGRLAMFRHLERGTQDDFFSVAAYVMAIGKGYLPWSDQPAFRWGFGMGLSYAASVPIVEQIKQERRNRNKTRFQNYLEMTIDFPLRPLLGRGRLGNCFVGLTTVHRSGIFASSDLLGDVSGGSDWLSAHLECMR